MDPLRLLREFASKHKEVTRDTTTNEIVFDKKRFPCNYQTSLRMNKGKGDTYSLESVWFLLQSDHLQHGEYIQECNKKKIQTISFIDKQEVISWLKGKAENIPQLDTFLERDEPATQNDNANDENADSQNTSFPSVSIAPLKLSEKELAAKEKFAKKIEEKTSEKPGGNEKEGTSDIKNMSEFSKESGISVENVLKIRQKRHRQKITGVAVGEEEIEALIRQGGTESRFDKLLEDEDLRSKIEKITKDITAREKPIRTSSTVLLSHKKSFEKIIKAIRDFENKKHPRPNPPPRNVKQYDRFNTNFWPGKESEAQEFQIDTHGSMNIQFLQGGVLPTPNKDKSKNTEPSAESRKRPRPSEPPSSQRPAKRPNISKVATLTGNPIIIVPASPSSLVMVYNINELLIQSKFLPGLDLKRTKPRTNTVEIVRENTTIPNKNTTLPNKFKVVDNPEKLKEEDWNNVIAVLAQGQEWQFKGWPEGKRVPADIFAKIKGFYFYFEDEKIPDNVKNWNVKFLAINKHKRHLDKAAALKFWREIDIELLKRIGARPSSSHTSPM